MFSATEIPPCHISIGDRIVSKRLGQMIPATVIGIFPATNLNILAKSLGIDLNKWYENYPDLDDDYLVMGLFDEPEKNWTIEDSISLVTRVYSKYPYFEDMVSTGVIKSMAEYDLSIVPETLNCYFPLADVEVL